MTDIQLVSTVDLVKELKSRHENIVVVTGRPAKIRNGKQEIFWDYRGNWLACLGLCDYAKDKVLAMNQPEGQP